MRFQFLTSLSFQCQDGECIERLYVCDGVTNCRDGDDELNCGEYRPSVTDSEEVYAC